MVLFVLWISRLLNICAVGHISVGYIQCETDCICRLLKGTYEWSLFDMQTYVLMPSNKVLTECKHIFVSILLHAAQIDWCFADPYGQAKEVRADHPDWLNEMTKMTPITPASDYVSADMYDRPPSH